MTSPPIKHGLISLAESICEAQDRMTSDINVII